MSEHINWQPIEGAPLDCPVLLYYPEEVGLETEQGTAIVSEWDDEFHEWYPLQTSEPTHWCELEAPADE